MKVTIGSNIMSLGAQRQLSRNSEKLSSVFERLASGQRINRASDDAAGLAIADSLRSTARVEATAIRNVNDGISASNILSGALQSQSQILTRLAELSEQSANGTFSNIQREALNTEYKALVEEIGRIGKTTSFNGVNLLDSTSSTYMNAIMLQAGIDGSLNSILSLHNTHGGAYGGVIAYNNLVDLTDAITAAFGETNVGYARLREIFGNTMQEVTVHDDAGNERTMLVIAGLFGGTHVSYLTLTRPLEDENKAVADSVWISEIDAGLFDILIANAHTINATTGAPTGSGTVALNLSNNQQGVTIDPAENILLLGGIRFSSATGSGAPNLGPNSNLEFTSLANQQSSRHALDTVRNRIDEVTQQIGKIGAFQSRAHIAIANLTTSRENNLAAEEQIRGTDIAEDTTALTQSQILQQTAAAVLAQANQVPALVLELLKQ